MRKTRSRALAAPRVRFTALMLPPMKALAAAMDRSSRVDPVLPLEGVISLVSKGFLVLELER